MPQTSLANNGHRRKASMPLLKYPDGYYVHRMDGRRGVQTNCAARRASHCAQTVQRPRRGHSFNRFALMLLNMLSYVSGLASAGRLISMRTVSATSFFGLTTKSGSVALDDPRDGSFTFSDLVVFCFGVFAPGLDAPPTFVAASGSRPTRPRRVWNT